MEKINSIIGIIISATTLIGVIILTYKHFADPDVESKNEIEKMKLSCDMKHADIDKNILVIKENHLKHIEKDISTIQNNQTKIFTILEERLPPNK